MWKNLCWEYFCSKSLTKFFQQNVQHHSMPTKNNAFFVKRYDDCQLVAYSGGSPKCVKNKVIGQIKTCLFLVYVLKLLVTNHLKKRCILLPIKIRMLL